MGKGMFLWWLVGLQLAGIRFGTCARVCVVCFRLCVHVCAFGDVRAFKEQKRQLRVGPCVVSRLGAHLGTARSCRYGAELAQKRDVPPTV